MLCRKRFRLGALHAASDQRFGQRVFRGNRDVGRNAGIVPALVRVGIEGAADRDKRLEPTRELFCPPEIARTVGLLAGLWSLKNIVNWETAHGAVAYATSLENQSGYLTHLVPPIKSSAAATIGLIVIVVTEVVAGSLALFGTWRMWSQRHSEVAVFRDAKRFAILGAGLAVLNWFLGFLVIGGTLIMMGPAEGMERAMRGASNMATLSFLTHMYLSMSEPARAAD